jgi:hypothetical protein
MAIDPIEDPAQRTAGIMARVLENLVDNGVDIQNQAIMRAVNIAVEQFAKDEYEFLADLKKTSEELQRAVPSRWLSRPPH